MSGISSRFTTPQLRILSVKIFLQAAGVGGLGLPVFEAMTCGAALVTTDNGGSRDYALQGRTALVAGQGTRSSRPPDWSKESSAEIARAMAALIDDETTRIRLAVAGAEHLRSIFDWGRCTRLTEELLMR